MPSLGCRTIGRVKVHRNWAAGSLASVKTEFDGRRMTGEADNWGARVVGWWNTAVALAALLGYGLGSCPEA